MKVSAINEVLLREVTIFGYAISYKEQGFKTIMSKDDPTFVEETSEECMCSFNSISKQIEVYSTALSYVKSNISII